MISSNRENIKDIVTANDSRRALRVKLLAARQSMLPDDKAARDGRIGARLLAFIDAQSPKLRSIALYLPIRGEPDLQFLFEGLMARGIELRVPVVVLKDAPLSFAFFTSHTVLKVGAYGILEPELTELVNDAPDLVVIPCVGFDGQNYRLGYGGGYYDRTLAGWMADGRTFKAVGVAYEHARTAFDIGVFDLPMDLVLTEG